RTFQPCDWSAPSVKTLSRGCGVTIVLETVIGPGSLTFDEALSSTAEDMMAPAPPHGWPAGGLTPSEWDERLCYPRAALVRPAGWGEYAAMRRTFAARPAECVVE